MKKAAFSIENYIFDKVFINLENNVSNQIALGFETKGKYISDKNIFTLFFSVIAFNEEKTRNYPFVEISCQATFNFENVSSFDDIPDYFYQNSIAILFPYVRAYISLVTNQANIHPLILPIMNLSSLKNELKKNTTQE